MTDTTENYGLHKPDVGGDPEPGGWATKLNENMDAIDTALQSLQDNKLETADTPQVLTRSSDVQEVTGSVNISVASTLPLIPKVILEGKTIRLRYGATHEKYDEGADGTLTFAFYFNNVLMGEFVTPELDDNFRQVVVDVTLGTVEDEVQRLVGFIMVGEFFLPVCISSAEPLHTTSNLFDVRARHSDSEVHKLTSKLVVIVRE